MYKVYTLVHITAAFLQGSTTPAVIDLHPSMYHRITCRGARIPLPIAPSSMAVCNMIFTAHCSLEHGIAYQELQRRVAHAAWQ